MSYICLYTRYHKKVQKSGEFMKNMCKYAIWNIWNCLKLKQKLSPLELQPSSGHDFSGDRLAPNFRQIFAAATTPVSEGVADDDEVGCAATEKLWRLRNDASAPLGSRRWTNVDAGVVDTETGRRRLFLGLGGEMPTTTLGEEPWRRFMGWGFWGASVELYGYAFFILEVL